MQLTSSSTDLDAELRIDTERLRLHKDRVTEELSLVASLVDRLQAVRYSDFDLEIFPLQLPLEEATKLRSNISHRIDTIDKVCDIFVRLQYEIATMLEDSILKHAGSDGYFD